MRVIVSGPVTVDHIATAELLFGIVATSWVTNGRCPHPPVPLGGYVDIQPIDSKLGVLGEEARDYTLCQHADAAIVVGHNPHLVTVAEQYGLPVHQE